MQLRVSELFRLISSIAAHAHCLYTLYWLTKLQDIFLEEYAGIMATFNSQDSQQSGNTVIKNLFIPCLTVFVLQCKRSSATLP
jgi:hypothetical protein